MQQMDYIYERGEAIEGDERMFKKDRWERTGTG